MPTLYFYGVIVVSLICTYTIDIFHQGLDCAFFFISLLFLMDSFSIKYFSKIQEMGNGSNINVKFKNLEEVISEEYFHDLFGQFIENRFSIHEEGQVELLEILAEKFEKFYDMNKLNFNERSFITGKLIELTKFSDFNRISNLIGLMFSFADNKYYEFLCDSLKTKSIPLNVQIEIKESIKEYKKTNFK